MSDNQNHEYLIKDNGTRIAVLESRHASMTLAITKIEDAVKDAQQDSNRQMRELQVTIKEAVEKFSDRCEALSKEFVRSSDWDPWKTQFTKYLWMLAAAGIAAAASGKVHW